MSRPITILDHGRTDTAGRTPGLNLSDPILDAQLIPITEEQAEYVTAYVRRVAAERGWDAADVLAALGLL